MDYSIAANTFDQVAHALGLISLWGVRLFLLVIASISLRSAPHLFLSTHGRSHRVMGGLQLVWLLMGATMSGKRNVSEFHVFLYDVILGCLGTAATLTAARDFPHKLVKNAAGQSGSLGEKAIVTQAEMREHSFYQVLNLVQVVYLHGLAKWGSTLSIYQRLVVLLVATSPWWIRRQFPVHSFSSNWKKTPPNHRSDAEALLYMIKKSQYVFYKHFVLHGLNICFALSPSSLPWTQAWRIFWLHLNVSYVMEFFMQSLVKRKVIQQQEMIWLQRLLITSATLSSFVPIFGTVRIELCLASMLLNFVNRHHDVVNTILVAGVAALMQEGFH